MFDQYQYEQQKIVYEILNLTKTYWLTTMEMMASFQEQNEKMWTTLVEQGLVSQQEGKKMLQEWMNRADQARDQLHKMIDDNWKRVESVFGSTPKTGK